MIVVVIIVAVLIIAIRAGVAGQKKDESVSSKSNPLLNEEPMTVKNNRYGKLFEKFYLKLTAQPIIKKAKNHKAVTAAYLFVLCDFMLMSREQYEERRKASQEIFDITEKYLSSEQLEVFDDAVELFGKIVRKEVRARGDWCFYDEVPDHGGLATFLCYGDLINAPHYIDDYERSPILIKGIDVQFSFMNDFKAVGGLAEEYLSLI